MPTPPGSCRERGRDEVAGTPGRARGCSACGLGAAAAAAAAVEGGMHRPRRRGAHPPLLALLAALLLAARGAAAQGKRRVRRLRAHPALGHPPVG